MTNKILAVVRPNRPEKTETQSESQPSSSQPSSSTLKKPIPRPNKSSRGSRPSRSKPQPLVELSEATNQEGESFNVGDQIWVRAPWGKWAIAEITTFYQNTPEDLVAQFTPKQEQAGWTWMGGCIRSALLKKVVIPAESE